MVLIAIGTGIGSGIIIEGALYRGSTEASGEIGHMIPGREFLGQDYQQFGAFESVASGTGIARRARSALVSLPGGAGLDELLAEDVFDAARQGQAWAWKIIDETVDYLAIAIADLAVSFDPDLIILGGGVARSADLLVEPILRYSYATQTGGLEPGLARGSNGGGYQCSAQHFRFLYRS
jgi:predicted NBD/HSP70 family sugar kinase